MSSYRATSTPSGATAEGAANPALAAFRRSCSLLKRAVADVIREAMRAARPSWYAAPAEMRRTTWLAPASRIAELTRSCSRSDCTNTASGARSWSKPRRRHASRAPELLSGSWTTSICCRDARSSTTLPATHAIAV
jgi:hypothetical protein